MQKEPRFGFQRLGFENGHDAEWISPRELGSVLLLRCWDRIVRERCGNDGMISLLFAVVCLLIWLVGWLVGCRWFVVVCCSCFLFDVFVCYFFFCLVGWLAGWLVVVVVMVMALWVEVSLVNL